jgi:hypothetical protein
MHASSGCLVKDAVCCAVPCWECRRHMLRHHRTQGTWLRAVPAFLSARLVHPLGVNRIVCVRPWRVCICCFCVGAVVG